MPVSSAAPQSQRLASRYAAAVAQCSLPASLYAKCVVQETTGVSKQQCHTEFLAFKDCIKNARARK